LPGNWEEVEERNEGDRRLVNKEKKGEQIVIEGPSKNTSSPSDIMPVD